MTGLTARRVNRAPLSAALAVALLFGSTSALAQVCAPASSYVTAPSTGVVNNYYAGTAGTLAVGATSLTLGALRADGLSTAIAVGDLLMVMQMQDGTYNRANNSSFGDGSGSGAGTTSVQRAGLFEFVRVTSIGGAIGFTPALSNSYVQADATATSGQKRYQVLRVNSYTSLTATGITAPAWNGSTGGVVAVDVQNTLTLGNGTREGQTNRAFFLAGKGFRGGAGRGLTDSGSASSDFMTLSTANYHGSKGEGIAGTPFFTATKTNDWGFGTTNPPALTIPAGPATAEGYPGGSYAAGAPGNAGGGGSDGGDPGANNQNNAGGGGGGNHAKGGIGGRPWANALKDSGGRGGAGYAGTLGFNRVFMGGGGGAGGTNNSTSDNAAYTNNGIACALGAGACSSGAAGGGIVIIRARTITGTGIIDVRGAHSYNVANDASGGGGAGGSVVLETINGGNATVLASGGDGGNAWAGQGDGLGGRHGPGGAGGGGFVAYAPTSLGVSANVDGGAPGRTMNNLTPEDSYGSSGFNGGLTTYTAPNVPGVPPAAMCDPNLSLTKTDGVTDLVSPGTTSYTFTVTNQGSAATSGTVTVADKLPAGLTVAAGALTVGGPTAAAWTCSAANTTDIYCQSTASVAGNGGTSSFVLGVSVSAANGTAVVNRARVAGGGDPSKPLPATAAAGVTAAAACTANNNPAGCALDTDTIRAPNLLLTKTNDTDAVLVGATTTYSLVVSNQGGTVTTGQIRVVDVLPTGLTYVSTPVTSGFTCAIAGQVLTCNRATGLAAGASATVTLRVSVDMDAPSSVANKAQVGGGGDPAKTTLPTATTVGACAGPVAPDTTSSDSNTGCAADVDEVRYVRLELTKDDGQVFASNNGFVDYVFTVSNLGTMASSGQISVRDALPGTMTVTAAITPGGVNAADWACTRGGASPNQFLNCTSSASIAAGGNSVFTVRVGVGNAGAGTQQKNLARVGGGGDVRTGMITAPAVADAQACVSNNNPLGCAVDLNTVQNAPEIRMTKTHNLPTQARNPGDAVVFTLTLRNNGGTDAARDTVRMVDVIPAGLTIGTVSAAAPFICTVTAPRVICNNTVADAAGIFTAGSTAIVTINTTVAADATNELVNRARIGGGGDPQNGTRPANSGTASSACLGNDVPNFGCATDTVPLNANLAVVKQQRLGTAGAFQSELLGVTVGGTVQYRITVNNAGAANATGVAIADTVPTNFGNVTWTCTTQGTATCSSASGSGNEIALTADISSGAANTVTVLVTAVANASTPIGGVTNTATITVPAGITDSNLANNVSSVPTAIGVTNLSITKSNGVNGVVAGSTVSYTLTAANNGPTAADGARIYDPVTPGLSCTAAPTCVASAGATCPAGLTAAQVQNPLAPTGVAIPTFGGGSTVTITMTCGVTASGQ
ncbi:MAG: hypothetical protein Q7T70_05730 [Polaromonas sp.]|nr:hypothetical protein [Polaromonas sp.]